MPACSTYFPRVLPPGMGYQAVGNSRSGGSSIDNFQCHTCRNKSCLWEFSLERISSMLRSLPLIRPHLYSFVRIRTHSYPLMQDPTFRRHIMAALLTPRDRYRRRAGIEGEADVGEKQTSARISVLDFIVKQRHDKATVLLI